MASVDRATSTRRSRTRSASFRFDGFFGLRFCFISIRPVPTPAMSEGSAPADLAHLGRVDRPLRVGTEKPYAVTLCKRTAAETLPPVEGEPEATIATFRNRLVERRSTLTAVTRSSVAEVKEARAPGPVA